MMRSRVSSSDRIGGRPRGLRTCSAICPIGIFQIQVDIHDISPISENIKFPNFRTRKSGPSESDKGQNPMNQHPDTSSIERPISAPGLANASLAEASVPSDSPPGKQLRARWPEVAQARREGRASGTALALSPPRAKGRRSRKLLVLGAGVMALAAAAYFGWQYWTVGRFEVSTDD